MNNPGLLENTVAPNVEPRVSGVNIEGLAQHTPMSGYAPVTDRLPAIAQMQKQGTPQYAAIDRALEIAGRMATERQNAAAAHPSEGTVGLGKISPSIPDLRRI